MHQGVFVTSDAALRDIRGLSRAGRIRLTFHARQRMRERGALFGDVVHALSHAVTCRAGDTNDKWKVTGPDTDGDDLVAVVVLDDDVLVVTMF